MSNLLLSAILCKWVVKMSVSTRLILTPVQYENSFLVTGVCAIFKIQGNLNNFRVFDFKFKLKELVLLFANGVEHAVGGGIEIFSMFSARRRSISESLSPRAERRAFNSSL